MDLHNFQKQKKMPSGRREASSSPLRCGAVFWGVLFVAGMVCIWMAQRAVPVMMDDEWYSTVLWEETPLTSLYKQHL